jgi:dTDP-4-dehydrorhamnose 3,5-epimerase
MKIEPTKIEGVYIIKREPFADERGSFARIFCKDKLTQAGLRADIMQANLSTNYKKDTLRGLHMQKRDAAEDKIVSCLSGAIFDVCIDMREDSPTYLQWVGEMLSEENGISLYVPKGCAHGYLSLTDNTRVLYFTTQFYAPGAEAGYRFDDPAFGINWPLPQKLIISEKDKNWVYIDGEEKNK